MGRRAGTRTAAGEGNGFSKERIRIGFMSRDSQAPSVKGFRTLSWASRQTLPDRLPTLMKTGFRRPWVWEKNQTEPWEAQGVGIASAGLPSSHVLLWLSLKSLSSRTFQIEVTPRCLKGQESRCADTGPSSPASLPHIDS